MFWKLQLCDCFGIGVGKHLLVRKHLLVGQLLSDCSLRCFDNGYFSCSDSLRKLLSDCSLFIAKFMNMFSCIICSTFQLIICTWALICFFEEATECSTFLFLIRFTSRDGRVKGPSV